MATTNGSGPGTAAALGDYPVTIAGETFTLRLSMAAMIACEEAERAPDGTLTPFHEIAARAGRSEMAALRRIFWALLRTHHAGVTIEEAGELFLAARKEGVNVMGAADEGHPAPEDLATLEATGDRPGRPRKRPRGHVSSGPMGAGTGAASTAALETPGSAGPRSSH